VIIREYLYLKAWILAEFLCLYYIHIAIVTIASDQRKCAWTLSIT